MLFDAGLSCRQIHKRLEAIGEDASALDAIVISHEHSDHITGLEVLARTTSTPVYLTKATAGTLSWKKSPPEILHFEAGRGFSIGDLDIASFTVSHDAVDPVGFCIRTKDTKLSIATDLGYMTDSVRHHLLGSDLLVLESNYDLEMLKLGPYPWSVKQRIMSRDGHLSNSAMADFLKQDWDHCAKTIVMAHLSTHNNLPVIVEMEARIALEVVGAKTTKLLVASQDQPTEMLQI